MKETKIESNLSDKIRYKLFSDNCIVVTACGAPYTSHYSATVLIQSNRSETAWVNFASLKGTLVYKLKVKDEDEFLRYYGKLGEGNITVYYDNEGTKEEWFSLQGGRERGGQA